MSPQRTARQLHGQAASGGASTSGSIREESVDENSEFLDELDIRILDELQTDVTVPLAELASRVASSKSVCWRRIKRLFDQRFITERVAILDSTKVGLDVMVFVFAKIDGRKLDDFLAAIRKMPEVLECHSLMGDIDLLLKVVVPRMKDYDRLWERLVKMPGVTGMHSAISMKRFVDTTRLPLPLPQQPSGGRRRQGAARREH